jgi:hypothetical protein
MAATGRWGFRLRLRRLGPSLLGGIAKEGSLPAGEKLLEEVQFRLRLGGLCPTKARELPGELLDPIDQMVDFSLQLQGDLPQDLDVLFLLDPNHVRS